MIQEPQPTNKALVLIKPPAFVLAAYIPTSARNVAAIFATAKRNDCLVYVGDVQKKNGKFVTSGPLSLLKSPKDFDIENLQEIPEIRLETESPPEPINRIPEGHAFGIACPYCDAILAKNYGLTNHVRTKHPDKFEEYQCQKSGKT